MAVHKCAECGYLTTIHPESKMRVESPRRLREEGIYTIGSKWFIPNLTCNASVREFPDFGQQEQVWNAIHEDVKCEVFVQWQEGRSPQDIEEMAWQEAALKTQERIADLQRDYLQWKKDQSDRDDHWEKQIQALTELRHQESRKDLAAWNNSQLWALWGTAMLTALVSLVVTILNFLSSTPKA